MQVRARIVLILQGLLMVLLVFAPFADSNSSQFSWIPQNKIQFSGMCLGLIGLVFMIMAAWSLGRSFTVNPAPKRAAPFVTAGVFRITRNPMYLGGLLIALGWALSFQSILTFVVAILLGMNLLYKIHLEEQYLALKFGSPYEDYKRQVKRLIPYLY